MSKHTPGPWEATSELGSIRQDAEGCKVVMVFDHQSVTGEDLLLIAAAPELLEALEECLAIVALQNGNLHEDTNVIQKHAQDAIRKAKGE